SSGLPVANRPGPTIPALPWNVVGGTFFLRRRFGVRRASPLWMVFSRPRGREKKAKAAMLAALQTPLSSVCEYRFLPGHRGFLIRCLQPLPLALDPDCRHQHGRRDFSSFVGPFDGGVVRGEGDVVGESFDLQVTHLVVRELEIRKGLQQLGGTGN